MRLAFTSEHLSIIVDKRVLTPGGRARDGIAGILILTGIEGLGFFTLLGF